MNCGSAVTPKTRLIAVCNPNNPTGAILTDEEMDGIVSIAQKQGCWLLADEVYQGAERDRGRTPSFWGRYERVIVTNGLFEGVRDSGHPHRLDRGDRRTRLLSCGHIMTTRPSVPELSATGSRRSRSRPLNAKPILARTRGILNKNYPILLELDPESWRHVHDGRTSRGRDRVSEVPAARQLHGTCRETARGEKRADRSWRSLRYGPFSAHRIRFAHGSPPHRAGSDPRYAGGAPT